MQENESETKIQVLEGFPWSKRPGEPVKHYSAFESYRLLGPTRTILAAYRAHTGTEKDAPANWFEWSQKWDWKTRAEAWDQYKLEQVRREMDSLIRNYHERRLAIGINLLAKIDKAVENLDWKNLKFREVVWAFDVVTKAIERLLGAPDAKILIQEDAMPRGLPPQKLGEIKVYYEAIRQAIAASGDFRPDGTAEPVDPPETDHPPSDLSDADGRD